MPAVFFVCAAAVSAASAQPSSAPAAVNAVVPFNNPLVKQRADPHVTLEQDGWYYYTATVPEYDRIEVRRARTLDELGKAEANVIWRKHASGPMSQHIWAPEIHRIDGKWYVYFTASRADRIWDIRLYVLECESDDPLKGPWKERGQLKTGWESFSLDATTFALNGQRYLLWTQRPAEAEKQLTAIYIAKMDTPLSISGPATLLTQPEYPWERVKYDVNEAPAVLVKNGKVFLTYSASATDANYAMGMLTASTDANLLDRASWAKSAQPVFASSAANGQYGPGHNAFTTTPDGKTDINLYHARDYRDIVGDSLKDPNRHTRAQVINWRPDGTPDFGLPVADQGEVAAKPLFRDPVVDGAADPVVIWNPQRQRWWMYYTARRANVAGLSGVAWVHGTKIGIAESADHGATWSYVGTADIELPPDLGGSAATHWAPDVIRAPDGSWQMYLTVVPGIFTDWKHPRRIVRLESTDLLNWRKPQPLSLVTDKVIDAAIAELPGGGWRMWYNNELDGKSIWIADSPDLKEWTQKGKAVGDQAGEGPKVFQWKGAWWMITDVWRGLGVYRSSDATKWTRQSGNLLQAPGKGVDDGVIGGHADVVVSGDRAFLFYFTHPGRTASALGAKLDGTEQRRSSLQVVELKEEGGVLKVDRDAPTRINLIPPQ